MVSYAVETLQETDFNLMLVEPLRHRQDVPAEDQLVLQHLQGRASNTILAINKIDGLPYETVLQSLERYRQLAEFAELIPISALKSHNRTPLGIAAEAPARKSIFFAEDQLTDLGAIPLWRTGARTTLPSPSTGTSLLCRCSGGIF